MDPSLAELASSLLVVGLLVVASAFFSGTEVAMFSLRRAERQRMAKSERGTDKLVTRLVANPRRLIATVLLGNETANVSLSAVMAGVGQQLFEGHPELSIALLTTAITLPPLGMAVLAREEAGWWFRDRTCTAASKWWTS